MTKKSHLLLYNINSRCVSIRLKADLNRTLDMSIIKGGSGVWVVCVACQLLQMLIIILRRWPNAAHWHLTKLACEMCNSCLSN